MRITGIEEQKKNTKKCNIYVDGEYYSSVDKEILKEVRLAVGMELGADEFNEKVEIIQYKSALKSALHILARSSKTQAELERKLKEKQYSGKAVNQVMDYLKSIGYINDESYAESFIGVMKNSAGTSSRSLYYKLAGKGVESEVIEQKLQEAELDDYSSALRAAQKKLVGLRGGKKEKGMKLLGFLYRKGFGSDVCRRVIEELELQDD